MPNSPHGSHGSHGAHTPQMANPYASKTNADAPHANNTNMERRHQERRSPEKSDISKTLPTQTSSKQKLSKITMDKQSGRLMMMVTVAFLIFYLLIVVSTLITDHNTQTHSARTIHQTQTMSGADHVSTVIDNSISWINNGLAEGETPAQTARMITKSPTIFASVILNGQNMLVAQYPDTATFLADVSLKGINENGIEISSVIRPNGQIIPVIIKRTGNYYAVAGLADDVLLKSGGATHVNPNLKAALIASSGRAIAGSPALGISGPQEWFNLSVSQMARLARPGTSVIEGLKFQNTDFRIVSVDIPNSQLKLIEARPTSESAHLKNSAAVFTILFLGTCWLVAMLLSSLYKQLRSTREIQRQTQISQQRYQAAVEGDRGGIWELDIPNNTAYLSASLAALLGMPRQEHVISISQFLNLFHPHERDKFLSIARRAHIQGEFEIDITVAHLPLILQCRGRPSTRTDQDFKRVIVGVALDITEQRGAQARLKAAEARLHSALSSMTDSFVVWDPNNRLVMWNIRFEEFFNLEAGALQAGADHTIVDYLARQALVEVIQNTEHPGWSEMKLKTGRWIRYIETPTAEGGRVSVGTDITEIRMREAELHENSTALKNTVDVLRKSQDRIFELAEGYEQEKIRAEEANQSKTDFLASMSHELRTPLNAINGFSDIMKKEMFGPLGDPRYKEYISDILFSGQHLLALINDILDMSKIEAGKMTLNTEVIFMHEMVAQIVRIIRGRAEDAQLNLDITTDEVREIEADPRAVKQILLNLMTNAIKFTPEGGTVGVELIEKQTGIIIKIKDSGIGISEENIELIAKPFEQGVGIDSGFKHKEGTGLGLALSKSLIELHGGNFKIESKLGVGTTVIFSLPNKPVEQLDDQEEHDVSREISRLAQDISDILGPEESGKVQTTQLNVIQHTRYEPDADPDTGTDTGNATQQQHSPYSQSGTA
ncbi:MAG: hypothetical protein COA69_01520 [Robiginitomaculum sp.]|nr:MAG: hypothetical protein COA69_01520 [Robiginitomaculum sp.]